MTTIKELNNLIFRINEITNSPTTCYSEKEGKLHANIGNFHLSQAYGGVCLHRNCNAAGGVTTPLNSNHEPKKDLGLALRAFITGLEFGKRGN